MDGPRFPAPARPRALSHPLLPTLSRRSALRLVGGGLAAAAFGTRVRSTGAAPTMAGPAIAALDGSPAGLGNPAGRVLLPGEAGLDDFHLDFSLTGPPAVFFAPGDTPGWSPELSATVGGFRFGYASTLARPHEGGGAGRGVQVCVHHGFPSTDDAGVAWFSLTAALAGGASHAESANVRQLDVVELFEVDGRRSILATVATDLFNAVVVASRAGATLVTVAIADFAGKRPTLEEAQHLIEVESLKLQVSHEGGTDLRSGFYKRWTPGFALGGVGGAPFFAWPTILESAPVPVAGETTATASQRKQFTAEVQYQSHVEGPLQEAWPAVEGHSLYYSGQSSYFAASRAAKTYQEETATRLRAGLPGLLALTEDGRTEREERYAYQVPSSFGVLSGLMLHALITDGEFPLTVALHILAVPNQAEAVLPSLDHMRERLRVTISAMRDGLADCLVTPQRAPLTITVASPS